MLNLTKVRTLTETVSSLESRIVSLETEALALKNQRDAALEERDILRKEQERLHQELGTTSAEETIALVRRLESQAQEQPEEDETDTSLDGLSDPRAVLIKIRTFTHKIESLNGAVASMEEQLMSLYEDKERLEREIGASEIEDVLEAFHTLQNVISSMETQLMTMYAGREHLEVELGVSEPREIVRKFRTLAGLVRAAHKELGPLSVGETGDATALPSGIRNGYAMSA